MSGSTRRNGSIPALWRHSRNYRRLGCITLCLGVLLLANHYRTAVPPPAAAGNTQTAAAQYQPPAAAVPPVTRAAPLPPAGNTADAPLLLTTTDRRPPRTDDGGRAADTAEADDDAPKILVAPELGELVKYRPLHDSWGEQIDGGVGIPAAGYDAYYVDIDDLSHPRDRRHSHAPAAWGDTPYLNISAANLGIYWVGQLHVPKTARYQFALHQGEYGRVRFSIDHRIIKDGEGTDIPEVELRRGVHIVEVEYRNNGAARYTFYLSMHPHGTVHGADDLAAALKALHLPANTVVYVATPVRAKNDRSSALYITPGNRPYILMLPVGWRTWQIHADNNPPRAVIRYREAGDVRVVDGTAPELLWERFVPLEKLRDGEPDCTCDAQAHTLHCAEDGFGDLGTFAGHIRRWTGYPLAGISFGRGGKQHHRPRNHRDSCRH